MSLANLFRIWSSGKTKEQAHKDVVLQDIQTKLNDIQNQLSALKTLEEKIDRSSIVVENLHVEKLVVEKVNYNNNIGAIGIRELKGKLNIGANYIDDILSMKDDSKEQKMSAQAEVIKKAPTYTIRAK